MSNTFNTRIIMGNAHTSDEIRIRKNDILNKVNQEAITKCIRAFRDLRFSDAFHKLVIMTCHYRDDFPESLWEEIQLAPNLIPDEAWNAFVDELLYQYKLTHPNFMVDISVPASCSEAYSALEDNTSQFAAYLFFKRAHTFLKDHCHNSIGQDQMYFVSNCLNWHSKDEELNKKKQLQALSRLSLRRHEAAYFHVHIKEVQTLFGNMLDYERELREQAITTELPFIITSPDEENVATECSNEPVIQLEHLQDHSEDPQSLHSTKPSVKELNLKNIIEYENFFKEAILMNSAQHLLELHMAGFELGQINAKRAIIADILEHHAKMVKASEALTK